MNCFPYDEEEEGKYQHQQLKMNYKEVHVIHLSNYIAIGTQLKYRMFVLGASEADDSGAAV
eukprot:11010480-Ditylum_brightwellii.AAC.1